MPEKTNQPAAPVPDNLGPSSDLSRDTPPTDRPRAKGAADVEEDTSVLPDPDEEGSALEEIDDSLVRVENS